MSMARQSEKQTTLQLKRRLAAVAKQNEGPIQHMYADQLTDTNYCDILVKPAYNQQRK